MMFAQVHCPETLAPEELDAYLENGWFRMGQTIFTTNFLNFKNNFYSAIWLRITLSQYQGHKTLEKLAKRNARFRNEVGKASIDPVKEKLYSTYKQNLSFETSSSLRHLMHGKTFNALFDTREICIYDDDKLIAVGYFDLGASSAAGITCFYDPSYKKFSLGRYLIYLKIEYCKKLNLEYFYPGYFVPGYPFFDYKLTIGSAFQQYLQVKSGTWLPIHTFTDKEIPLQYMREKLSELQSALMQVDVESKILKYEFFDANLVPELQGAELFDFPLFLIADRLSIEIPDFVVIYDVCEQRYHLLRCKGIWKTNSAVFVDTYASHVLKVGEDLFSSENAEDLCARILLERKYTASRTGTR